MTHDERKMPAGSAAADRVAGAVSKSRHQHRLEALGALASGVAHEINNPMQSIMNYAQLIRNRSDAPQLQEYAGEILHEAQRVATIVRNLLSFARQEGEPYTEASMLEMVTHTLSLTAAVLRKEQIEVTVSIAEDLPAVNCHPQQIQQVIMNLVTYCRDALNARYPASDPNKRMVISASQERVGGAAVLRTVVEDRSNGVPATSLPQLFDAFDMDADQRGSGLGLALCHAIVSDHGGDIRAESEPGKYMRFLFDLPLPEEG